MEKSKNIKIFIGLFYLLLLFVFLFFFFSKFTLNEIASYEFIKINREYLISLKNVDLVLSSVIFVIFTILWVFLMGFASPVIILSGFVFGKWLGTLLSIGSLAIGSTLLFIFANYFFKDLITKKFSGKFENLKNKFKQKEFLFFLIYRFVGGIPFQVANLIPVIFNVKIKNYFFGTFFGMMVQGFVFASLGSGLEKIIESNNSVPKVADMLVSPEIYLPILGFIFLIFLSLIIKTFFYKN